jgi:hypothetical protein
MFHRGLRDVLFSILPAAWLSISGLMCAGSAFPLSFGAVSDVAIGRGWSV